MSKKSKEKRLFKRYRKGKLIFRNIRFFIFYLILLVAIGFGFYKVYLYVDESLTNYEKAQSSYVAEDMAKFFTERKYEALYDYEDASKLDIETKDDYVAYLNKLTEGTYISYKEVDTREPNIKKYSVASNGKTFASFTIQKSGESLDCGLLGIVDLYEFGSVSTDIIQPISYQVTIPDDANLYVNGNIVDRNKIIKSDIETFATGHLPEGYPSYSLCTYQFSVALGVPIIKANNINGSEILLKETSQDVFESVFSFDDEELKPVHEEYIVDVAEKICMFMSKKTSRDAVLKTMQKDSKAAKAINETNAMWLSEAKKYSFRNVRTENYFRYSEDVFSCELYFDYDIVAKNNVENSYPYHIRFFVQRVGNEWKVYDFIYI